MRATVLKGRTSPTPDGFRWNSATGFITDCRLSTVDLFQHAIHHDAEAAKLHAEHCDRSATAASEQEAKKRR